MLKLDFTNWQCGDLNKPNLIAIPRVWSNIVAAPFETQYHVSVSLIIGTINVGVTILCKDQQWTADAVVSITPMVNKPGSLHCNFFSPYNRASPTKVLGICNADTAISLTGGINVFDGVNDSTWTITK